MAANTKKKKLLGSVCKGGKGWTARYYDLDRNNERERRTKRGFTTEEEAYAFVAVKEKELKNKEAALSKYVENREITLRDYMVNWFEHIYSKKIANSTETTYRYALYKYLLPSLDEEYPGLRLVDLKKESHQPYYSDGFQPEAVLRHEGERAFQSLYGYGKAGQSNRHKSGLQTYRSKLCREKL